MLGHDKSTCPRGQGRKRRFDKSCAWRCPKIGFGVTLKSDWGKILRRQNEKKFAFKGCSVVD